MIPEVTEEDRIIIQSLLHARPHSTEQGQQIAALYRKYINPGDTAVCSKCGGSLFNYLNRLATKIGASTISKG